MTRNHKIIVIGLVILMIIVFTAAAWFWRAQTSLPSDGQPIVEKPLKTSLPGSPAFLDLSEQAPLGIATDSPVQIFQDASGDNVVYKIIRTDGEVVDDPGLVGSVSPQQKLPTAE